MMGPGFGEELYRSFVKLMIVVMAVCIGVGYAVAKLLPHLHFSFHWS